MAIASLVLGIVGLILGCVVVGFFPAVIGLILGIVAIARNQNKGMAIAGVICSAIGIMFSILSVIGILASDTGSTSGTATVESSVESTVVPGATTSIAETPQSLADQVTSQLYTCRHAEEYFYAALVVQNNSDQVVHLEVNFIAKDADGNSVEASSASEDAIAPGQQACLWTMYGYEGDISSVDYTLTVSRETYYESIYDDVSFEYNTTESGCVVTATNNGSEAADFVCAECVFLKDGEMVYHNFTYLTDDDSELKPGATIAQNIDCYSDSGFDDVIVTVTGRR